MANEKKQPSREEIVKKAANEAASQMRNIKKGRPIGKIEEEAKKAAKKVVDERQKGMK
jgi:hypothetical protein